MTPWEPLDTAAVLGALSIIMLAALVLYAALVAAGRD